MFVTCSKNGKGKEVLEDWISRFIKTQILPKNIQTDWCFIRPFQITRIFLKC
jgi:hypothetical protein